MEAIWADQTTPRLDAELLGRVEQGTSAIIAAAGEDTGAQAARGAARPAAVHPVSESVRKRCAASYEIEEWVRGPHARCGPHLDKTAIVFEGKEMATQNSRRSVALRAHCGNAVWGGRRPSCTPRAEGPSLAETFFAVTMLGAIIVPLNARLSAAEHSYIPRRLATGGLHL